MAIIHDGHEGGEQTEIQSDTQSFESIQAIPSFVGQMLTSQDGTRTAPFYSRFFPMAFAVSWLSQENPSDWMTGLKRELESSHDQHLGSILEEVVGPLNDILLHRNWSMLKAVPSDHGGRLSSSTEVTMHLEIDGAVLEMAEIPEHVSDLSKDTSNSIFANVCTTHILSQLMDRIVWAVNLRKNGGVPNIISLFDTTEEFSAVVPVGEIYRSNVDEKVKSKLKPFVDWHREVHASWRQTVRTFIQDWENHVLPLLQEDAQKEERSGQRENQKEKGKKSKRKEKLKDLFEEVQASERKLDIFKVLLRLHDCALALGTFQLFDLNGEMERSSRAEFNFHNALL